MRKTPEERSQLIAEFEQSSQSQKEFCEAKGLNKSTLSYWLKKKKSPPPGGFLPVEVTDEKTPGLELTYPNGVKLSLQEATPEFISQLIKLYSPC